MVTILLLIFTTVAVAAIGIVFIWGIPWVTDRSSAELDDDHYSVGRPKTNWWDD